MLNTRNFTFLPFIISSGSGSSTFFVTLLLRNWGFHRLKKGDSTFPNLQPSSLAVT